jgi:hypothetical protein
MNPKRRVLIGCRVYLLPIATRVTLLNLTEESPLSALQKGERFLIRRAGSEKIGEAL